MNAMNAVSNLDLPSVEAIILAIIAILPPTIMAWAAVHTARKTGKRVHKLEIEVDGRLTQLLEATRAAATTAGELKGAEDERGRQR